MENYIFLLKTKKKTKGNYIGEDGQKNLKAVHMTPGLQSCHGTACGHNSLTFFFSFFSFFFFFF